MLMIASMIQSIMDITEDASFTMMPVMLLRLNKNTFAIQVLTQEYLPVLLLFWVRLSAVMKLQ